MLHATCVEAYVLGHSGRELKRLGRQVEIFADMTRDVLQRAGIGAGMRVLDLGSGVGDVSLIAASLVGPAGLVVGIDQSEGAVAKAKARAADEGHANVTFEVANLAAFDRYGDFDAVKGRFLLLHISDPSAAIAQIVRQVKPGTIIALRRVRSQHGSDHPRHAGVRPMYQPDRRDLHACRA